MLYALSIATLGMILADLNKFAEEVKDEPDAREENNRQIAAVWEVIREKSGG